MDVVKLNVRSRTVRGAAAARRLRTAGWIPAVCYGRGRETLALEVSARELGRLARAKQLSHLIDLGLGTDGNEFLAVIKEIQRDVLRKDMFLHVDFQRVSMHEKITVQVPLEIAGVPIGVKEEGGILEHPIRFLTIRCLPADIPEKIVVEVSNLRLGDSIHVKEVHIDKADVINSPEEVVAVVSVPAKEEAAAQVAPAEAAETAPKAEGAVAEAGAAPSEGTAGATEGGSADAGGKGSGGKDQRETKDRKSQRDSK